MLSLLASDTVIAWLVTAVITEVVESIAHTDASPSSSLTFSVSGIDTVKSEIDKD